MTIKAEVGELKSDGESAIVTLINVQSPHEAEWRPYGPSISFRVPISGSPTYRIGRAVKITVEAK